MPVTSLGRVSNSSSRSFTNAKATIANVNYGRILGSLDNKDLIYINQQIHSTPSIIINLPVSNTQFFNNTY